MNSNTHLNPVSQGTEVPVNNDGSVLCDGALTTVFLYDRARFVPIGPPAHPQRQSLTVRLPICRPVKCRSSFSNGSAFSIGATQTSEWTSRRWRDTAAFTASAAVDPPTPRFLRIAGDQLSARELMALVSEVTGAKFRLLHAGGLGMLGTIIKVVRTVAPRVRRPGKVGTARQ